MRRSSGPIYIDESSKMAWVSKSSRTVVGRYTVVTWHARRHSARVGREGSRDVNGRGESINIVESDAERRRIASPNRTPTCCNLTTYFKMATYAIYIYIYIYIYTSHDSYQYVARERDAAHRAMSDLRDAIVTAQYFIPCAKLMINPD